MITRTLAAYWAVTRTKEDTFIPHYHISILYFFQLILYGTFCSFYVFHMLQQTHLDWKERLDVILSFSLCQQILWKDQQTSVCVSSKPDIAFLFVT